MRHCSVPNHWTIIFKIRQTKNIWYLLLCRTHETWDWLSFLWLLNSHEETRTGTKLTSIHRYPIYTSTAAVTSHSTNPVVVSQQSNFECQIESINFSLRTFLIRLPTAISPSPYLRLAPSIVPFQFARMQLARNCTAQRLLCVWWANISIEVDGMRIVVQRQAAVATSSADGSCNKNNIGIKFHKLYQERILNEVFFRFHLPLVSRRGEFLLWIDLLLAFSLVSFTDCHRTYSYMWTAHAECCNM